MKLYNIIIIFSLAMLTFSSCKKDDAQPTPGTVGINFEHVWGADASEFGLNKELTHPMLGEKMTFTTFKYYVSNLRLKSKTGTWYAMPESYFIVDASDASSLILDIPNVPADEYTDVEMTFGVDSTRCTSGAQTGALDPAKGIFWSWNSGYIMVKAEGSAPTAANGSFTFHLGGFKGANKVQTTKSYNFGTTHLVVDGDREAEIHLVANPARLWHGAEKLAVKSVNTMPNALAKSMSGNFYDAIKFDHIHN
jgi:hypothetical protein